MITDEIEAFKRNNITPNALVISSNLLHYMKQWEDIQQYYTPAFDSQTKDGRARYIGLLVVEAIAEHSDDQTRTPGTIFVCYRAECGKLKGPLE